LTTNQQFNGLVVKDDSQLLAKYLFYFSYTLKDKLLAVSGKTTIDFSFKVFSSQSSPFSSKIRLR
jgi:hypothetical protein